MYPLLMARSRGDVDYYAVLGVSAEATDEEIRRTYRRLALQWHPDRNPGNTRAEERFKEISEAYAVLMDPAKRRTWEAARRAGDSGGFSPSREDVFRDLFNDPRASAIFEELARELSRMGMRVDRHDFERTLFGGGRVSGAVFVITPGTALRMLGRVAGAALKMLGRRLIGLPLAPPADAGRDVSFPLRLTRIEADRGGRKRVTLRRADGDEDVVVRIPAGVRAGTRLRLRGKGRPLPGGDRGDAYLIVEVA
jgi:DnaJ-class molecular chaperone